MSRISSCLSIISEISEKLQLPDLKLLFSSWISPSNESERVPFLLNFLLSDSSLISSLISFNTSISFGNPVSPSLA